MGVAQGGEARPAGARPLVGSVRGGAAASGAPAAAMNLSRLCRLLKPALLCGTLAASGLASTMVSAAPAAGRGAVGRTRGAAAGSGGGRSGAGLGRLGPPLGACGEREAGGVEAAVGGGGAGRPRPLASPAGARRAEGARWTGRSGSRAAGRPRPSPTRRGLGACLVASQTGGRAPWLPAFLCPGAGLWAQARPGMGRAAASSPGRRGQRRRLPGRRRQQQRRRRRVPGRRKARAGGRRRARPGRGESCPESPGPAELETWDSGCRVECPEPVRAGPPPRPLGTWRGPKPSLGPSGFSPVCAAAQRACALAEESSWVFPCPGAWVFLARIRLGALPPGTPGRRVGQVAGGSGLCAPRSPRRSCAFLAWQCASRDDWRCAQSMHEFSAKDIDGRTVNLDKYRWVPERPVGEAGERLAGPSRPDGPLSPAGASCASSPTWPRNEAKQT